MFQKRIAYRYLSYSASFLFVAALVLGTVFIYFNYRQQEQQLHNYVTSKAEFLSAVIPEPVYFRDFLTLETLVKQTSQDDDIVYAVIVDLRGQALTRYLNREDARIANTLDQGTARGILEVIEVVKDEYNLIELRIPVETEGVQLAEVRVGYSLRPVQASATYTAVLAVIGLGALIALLIISTVILFNRQIGIRLREVTEAAGRIADGQLDIAVDVQFDDEIGMLKRSMNTMATKLKSNDIERKAAEASLLLSEARNRAIVTTAVDGIITIDEMGNIDSFNQAATAMFGYEQEEVLGKNVKLIMPDPDHSAHDQYMHNYLSTGKRKVIGVGREVTGKRKSGEHFPLYLSVSEINIEGRRLFTGILRDISAQKAAEAEIQNQRDFALQIMNTMGQGLTVTNTEGVFEFVNPAYAKMLGYESEDLIGKSPRMLSDQEADQEALKKASEARLQGKTTTYETRINNRQGEPIYALITGAPLRRDGEIVGAIAVVTDLTERHRTEAALQASEERNRLIVDTALDAVVVIDENGVVTTWNPQAEDVFGWNAEEAVGQKLSEMIIPSVMRKSHEDGMRNYFETGHGPVLNKRFEITAINREGLEFPVELAISPTKVGGSTHFSAFIRDISLRQQARAALEDARDQALEASRLKSEFLATMSHEIRTPMNGVIGMSEILLDTPLDEEQRDYANIIVTEAQSLLTIINDILDFSKIEAGKVILESIDFELTQLIDGVLDSFRLRAQDKGLELIGFVDPHIPTYLLGDPVRLRQVLVNLIGNAIKFTHEGEIEIRLETIGAISEQATIVFQIRDTGIGMSSEVLSRLFEAFTQADSSSTRMYGGTGLGLAISRRLINLMGGDIQVESEVYQGSTFQFVISFPVSTAFDDESSLAKNFAGGFTCVAIAKNQTRQKILADYLAVWGGEVDSVSDLPQALELMKTALEKGSPYDVLFWDDDLASGVALNDVSFEIAQALGENAPTQIYVGVNENREAAEQSLENGFSHVLYKPLKAGALRAMLATILEEQEDSPSVVDELSAKGNDDDSLDTQPSHRVLIVEDNVVNKDIAILHLTKLGYRSDVAMNGAEAVRVYAKDPSRYQLILMDLQMPIMDGYEATKEIRKIQAGQNREIPIIACTANVVPKDRARALEAGMMDDYLTKPFTRGRLKKMLERWITQ